MCLCAGRLLRHTLFGPSKSHQTQHPATPYSTPIPFRLSPTHSLLNVAHFPRCLTSSHLLFHTGAYHHQCIELERPAQHTCQGEGNSRIETLDNSHILSALTLSPHSMSTTLSRTIRTITDRHPSSLVVNYTLPRRYAIQWRTRRLASHAPG